MAQCFQLLEAERCSIYIFTFPKFMNIIHNKRCKLVLSLTQEFVVDLHNGGR